MNRLLPILLASLACATAKDAREPLPSIVRHIDPASGVVWDAPAKNHPRPPTAARLGQTEQQHWELNPLQNSPRLLRQQLTDPYLPSAGIQIRTLDPHAGPPRTRVDQPFTVHLGIAGLLTEGDFPESVSRVVLTRDLAPVGEAATIPQNSPRSGYITSNGDTTLRFQASALVAPDPTRASGYECFAVHALDTSGHRLTRLATASVRVLPVASGQIRGIKQDQTFTRSPPKVELILTDLYPQSETELLLFSGTGIHGKPAIVIKRLMIDRQDPYSTALKIGDFSARITQNGTYTLVLASTTIYGREQLCPPVSFRIERPQKPIVLPVSAIPTHAQSNKPAR